jgi:hypothetical protein
MQNMLHADDVKSSSKLLGQALSFFMHTTLALGSWSMLVPFVVGNIVTRFRQDEMATLVWLIGLIWVLIISLWILDMPTGPNACFQCDATEKLTRTFFSLPKPSGLIDDDGPILGTWPAAALIGYAIGARFALKRRPPVDD